MVLPPTIIFPSLCRFIVYPHALPLPIDVVTIPEIPKEISNPPAFCAWIFVIISANAVIVIILLIVLKF